VYTNHCTLENFDKQKDLSQHQLQWQEFMSQYNIKITYIHGEDNTVANTLSCLPPDTFPVKTLDLTSPPPVASRHITAILSITTDTQLLNDIITGYQTNDFCQQLPLEGMKAIQQHTGLWYLHDQLIVPCTGTVHKQLYRLAHNNSGHFGADKSYAALHGSYYWPNMCHNLEHLYIPSCEDCQQNKSSTTKPVRPLHPLPVPDTHSDSITINFVGPLPVDQGYDCILTMTNHLNADLYLVLCHLKLTAKYCTQLFFDHWYCENSLPLEIVSN